MAPRPRTRTPWHGTLSQGTDPARWLPPHVFYYAVRDLWIVQSPRATWADLHQALAYEQTLQERARRRG